MAGEDLLKEGVITAVETLIVREIDKATCIDFKARQVKFELPEM